MIDVSEDDDEPLARLSLPTDVIDTARVALDRDRDAVITALVPPESAGDLRLVVVRAASLLARVLELEEGLAMPDEVLAAVADAAGMLGAVDRHGAALDGPDEDDASGDEGDDPVWHDVLDRIAADCTEMLTSRFRRRRDGSFTLRWDARDRAVIADAIAELRGLMSSDDPAIARLFPSPYGDDAERNAGWDVLVRGELIERRLDALQRVESMFDRRTCSADELSALMRSVNDARLVVGTRLDVSEDGPPLDMTASEASAYRLYEHLTSILAHAIRALSGS